MIHETQKGFCTLEASRAQDERRLSLPWSEDDASVVLLCDMYWAHDEAPSSLGLCRGRY